MALFKFEESQKATRIVNVSDGRSARVESGMGAGVMLLDVLDRVAPVVFSAVHHSRSTGANKNVIIGFIYVRAL